MKKQKPLPKKTSATSFPIPFVKWAGGKRKLAPLLIETFPQEFNPLKHRYFEPFIGGGALMFALGQPDSELNVPGVNLYINDMNPELTNTYEVIRDNVTALIKELEILSKRINEKTFYEIRSVVPRGKVARAARFIYLNKTCFNGLWRVNSKGEFNVPFGKSKNPTLYVEENLRACSKRLKGSTITNLSFEKAVSKARKGDLVYFDPPYIPMSASASFSAYAKEGFGLNEQELLAETIAKLNTKGVYVLLSNSDTPITRKIFRKSLTLRKVLMSRSISSSGSTRKPVYEVLGMNYSHLRGSAMGDLDLISRPN
ncbi:DNA adenine methylase [Candidatus Planktophila dulcis]|uniref:DNA adenine methylase n=1 Tax=Candidatus Planktophila dulcis TaxID=1884914 RepID=UPI003CF37567